MIPESVDLIFQKEQRYENMKTLHQKQRMGVGLNGSILNLHYKNIVFNKLLYINLKQSFILFVIQQ